VLYATVDLEDLFSFKTMVEELCAEEECSILSFKEL
jgi:hypothetical protein